jgi:integrase
MKMTSQITTKRSDPARRGLKFDEWPEGDQRASDAAIADGDVFDGRGRGARWSEATRKTNRIHYSRWLGYLAYIERLNPYDLPEDRVIQDSVENFIRHLIALGTTAPYTRLAMLVGLKEVIRAMAPDRDWRWLQDLCNRLNRQAEPTSNKEKRIRSTVEIYDAALKGLAALPSGPLDKMGRNDYRDLLMLALLAARPLRTRNFTWLEIGRHVIRVGDRWLITIPADETKRKFAVEFWMPADLVPWFERYLEEVRPLFPGADGTDQLWLHDRGHKLPSAFLYRRIVRLTKNIFGAPINPHLLRDCAATTLSLESSDLVRAAPALLGHRSPVTTARYYVQARNLEASRTINGILANIKADLERIS